MTGEDSGAVRRPARLAGLVLLVAVLAPTPLTSSPRSLAQALAERFPAIRGRLQSDVSFERTSWRDGGRRVAGLRVVLPSAEPNARLRPAASGPGTPAAAEVVVDRVRVTLPSLSSDPVVAEGEGVRVVLAPVGARSGRAEAEGALVGYRDVYPETDALHVAKPDWTEEYLHLRSPAAPRRFEYEIVEAAGATRVLVEGGQVRFVGNDGKGVVVLAPVVVDAIGRRSATAARWRLDDASAPRRLVLELDPAGFDYPLLVDPTWITTGSLNTARSQGIGVLLHTGKVLVMAGAPNTQQTSELYDPATGIWSPAGAIGEGHALAAAVMLRDGRVLLTGGANSGGTTASCRFFDPQTNGWTMAPTMNSPRREHTVTLLADGRVLVAGGYNPPITPLATAEIFDPALNTWTPTLNMVYAHGNHVAARLQDGRVLVAGGVTLPGPSSTRVTEVFDPGTGVWTRVGDLATARYNHSGTVLPNGSVLVAGGSSGVGTAETFNPATGLWTATAPLITARGYHSATLLPNGRVLVAGGGDAVVLSSTEIYDPGAPGWSAGPNLSFARFEHAATMLPDGRVLAVGGQNGPVLATAELFDNDAPAWGAGPNMGVNRSEHSLTLLKDGRVLAVGGVNRNSAEVFDGGAWAPTANTMSHRRWRHTATLLGDGQVLVAGSIDTAAAGISADLYNPATSGWTATASMSVDRYWHTATLLPCGEVLVAGGQTIGSTILGSAERYNPKTKTWRLTASLQTARWRHSATLLADGRVLVAGGWNGGRLASAEIYDPVAETWSPAAGTMTSGRYHHAATLLPSGKVLIAGGALPSSAELFNPATLTFAATGSPTATLDTGMSLTLLPNGRVLAAGGFQSPGASTIYDPAVGAWTAGPALAPTRDDHAASLLLDGRVLVAGGSGGAGNATAFYSSGRGEIPAWRPVLSTATDPLVRGAAFNATGTGLQGLGEGSTGLGYMHSATNYPLVQLRRLDNQQVRFLPVEPTVGWSGTSFRSTALSGFPNGPALVTVFTNGIPSASRALMVECPPPGIVTPPVSASACVGGSASFAVSATAPAGDCPSYTWRKGGVPLAEAAPYSGSRTPTLSVSPATLAEAGSYDVQVQLACSNTTAAPAAVTLTVNSAMGAVDASISGPTSVCTTCLGGIASETHAGGGAVTHQWGYRTTSGGAITDIPFASSPTYVLNGADFPAEDNYFLVVRVTPACGAAAISDEVPVTVANTAGPADEVPFFTVTSRNARNVLEWVYPAGFNAVRIRYTTGSPCVYPSNPLSSGTLLVDKTGIAGAPDKHAHDPATAGTTYCYTVFVDKGGTWSAGRTNQGRVLGGGWSNNIVWSFGSGAFSTTAPTVGTGGVIATNNANAVHAMGRGMGGGEWPAGWKPLLLGGAVQNRSPVIPLAVNSVNPVVYMGAQDGFVYAVNGATGGAGTAPWPAPTPLGGLVQAAPAGIFTGFLGAYDYLLVGTREATADNAFKALDPADGSLIDSFDNGGGASGIGIISAMAAVDYATDRVYFTSRVRAGGSANTLWCLQLGPAGSVFTLAWARDDLGDIESAPVLRGGRVYVGSSNAGGTLYSIDAATGGSALDRTFVHGDGPVKGFAFPDRASATGDLYFAANTRVWGVTEIAGALANKFAAGIQLFGSTPPSTALFHTGSHYLYVGGSDGGLYQIDTQGPGVADLVAQFTSGPLVVGAPSLDRDNGLIHVGTETGVFYAVPVPAPDGLLMCVSSCAGRPDGLPCSSFGALPCFQTCVAGSCF